MANLQWFQVVNEISRFYCHGLEQWTAPDNNSADFYDDVYNQMVSLMNHAFPNLLGGATHPHSDTYVTCSSPVQTLRVP